MMLIMSYEIVAVWLYSWIINNDFGAFVGTKEIQYYIWDFSFYPVI